MNTRKYPRTLEEAFGPYQRGPVHEPAGRRDTGYGAAWWAIVTICAIVGLAVIVTTGAPA